LDPQGADFIVAVRTSGLPAPQWLNDGAQQGKEEQYSSEATGAMKTEDLWTVYQTTRLYQSPNMVSTNAGRLERREVM
jgi:hypothetical protein